MLGLMVGASTKSGGSPLITPFTPSGPELNGTIVTSMPAERIRLKAITCGGDPVDGVPMNSFPGSRLAIATGSGSVLAANPGLAARTIEPVAKSPTGSMSRNGS